MIKFSLAYKNKHQSPLNSITTVLTIEDGSDMDVCIGFINTFWVKVS